MKTLPDELVDDLRVFCEDIEEIVDEVVREEDVRLYPSSIIFAKLKSLISKHWPNETQLTEELKKLKVNNRKPKEK